MPPALRDRDRTEAAAARPTTRKRNGSLTTPDEYQDIKTASDGRKFLEKYSLLCPPGEPLSNGALSICLHQISAMPGLPKQAINAVRSTAFLLEELEEYCINETIRSAFNSQITEFTSDIKLLIDDVNTKVDNHLKTAVEQLTQNTTEGLVSAGNGTPTFASRSASSYASALINPPPHVNPKLAAREGIRARQFLLDGAAHSDVNRRDPQQLKADLNKALRGLNMKEGKIRSVIPQRNGGTLIEVDSDALAKWFANPENKIGICGALGDGVSFRTKLYNVLAFNVPLTLDPGAPGHREEINEINDLEGNTVAALRWAKPIARRSPNQRSAHLVLSFSNPVAANRAISNGIIICHKKCHVERMKKEPIRCLKCQGWNHMANQCERTWDICSNCAGDHRTSNCPRPRSTRCVTCSSNDHASWSRECPSFIKRLSEFNERNPENSLPFFPTADPWTWSGGDTNFTNNAAKTSAPTVSPSQNKGKGKQTDYGHRRPTVPCGTHSPEYSGRPEQSHQSAQPNDGWWDNAMNEIMDTSSPGNVPSNTQTSNGNKFTFVNNSGAAGSSRTNTHIDA